MKRPIESNYTSQVSYTRALEAYCDTLTPTSTQCEVQPAQGPVAVYEAVSAIYFADGSDYLPALWSVVRALAPDLVALLESNPSAAWQQAEKRKDSAVDTTPALKEKNT